MIANKTDLKKCIRLEKSLYYSSRDFPELYITADICLKLFRYVKLLRYTEYHHNHRGGIHKILYALYRRRKNILGTKLGIEIWDNSFDEGLLIYHAGDIVVNGNARIGKNCQLHGNNCIGNSGKSFDAPHIGNNVDIGVGAKIIGNVTLADNITVAAGAVVVNSFNEENITIGGIPAKKLK